MRNIKRVLASLVVAAIAASTTVPAMATEEAAGLPSFDKDDRFSVIDSSFREDGSFSMISSDGELVIHINEGMAIYFEDGISVRESLEETGGELAQLLNGRQLVVTYSIATRSLPPQTTPEMVVVMYEQIMPLSEGVDMGIMPLPLPIEAGNGAAALPAGTGQDEPGLTGFISIHGEVIEAPMAYMSNGVVMVPVRAIAEHLGFDVHWDGDTRQVRLGVAINLQIGQDSYTIGRAMPVSLGAAPELTGSRTFVPLNFFADFVGGYEAFVASGTVVIDTALVRGAEVPEGVQIEDPNIQ